VILKKSWAGEVSNLSVLIAIGVGSDGVRQILGGAEARRRIWRAGAASGDT